MSPEDRISDQPRPGRPRGFDEDDALRAAMDVFWRQGFEASSLDDLTRAMGLSRSSFYACFGSKRDALIAAIGVYARDRREALKARLAEAGGPRGRAETVVAALADPEAGRNGCFMVNCLTELAPSDPEVAEIGRSHLERLTAMAAEALAEADPDRADARAAALVAMSFGLATLSKAGAPVEARRAAAAEARRLALPPRDPPAG